MGVSDEIDEYDNLKTSVVNSGTLFHGTPVPVDEKTANEDIPLPHPLRPAVLDSVRFREAFDIIDTSLFSNSSAIAALSDVVADHAGNGDNPHATTAAQVGAYTKAETDAAISDAASAIVNSAGADLDTLGEAEARIEGIESSVSSLEGNRVAVHEDQAFTAAQQEQARRNILAAPLHLLSADANIAINGSFQVSQENADAAGSIQNYFAADQFAFVSTIDGSAFSAQRVSDAPPGLHYSLQATATANGSLGVSDRYAAFHHAIEGTYLKRSGIGSSDAKDIAVGVWVKASASCTLGFALSNNDHTHSFRQDLIVSSPDTWEFKTFVIPAYSLGVWGGANSRGAVVHILAANTYTGTAQINGAWGENFLPPNNTSNQFASSGFSFQFTGLTLIPGLPYMTEKLVERIQRPYPCELEICRRYWHRVHGNGWYPVFTRTNNTINAYVGPIPHKQMRSAPVITLGGTMKWHKNYKRIDTTYSFLPLSRSLESSAIVEPTFDDSDIPSIMLEGDSYITIDARM